MRRQHQNEPIALHSPAPPSEERSETRASPTPRLDPDAEVAFETLYARYFDFVCRSLAILGVAPEALEDAAQEVFLVVLRRLPEFAGLASVRTWLFAIAQRTASNQRRGRRRREGPLAPLTAELEGAELDPHGQAEAAQSVALIREYCARLEEGHRIVLVLVLLEGVPARELAESLEIPLPTVYSRIRSIRAGLKHFLSEHEVSSG